MKKFWACAICFCLVFSAIPVQAKNSGDDGYFLSMKQKGQLIGTGIIKDDKGHQYKVLIVPGYQPPITSGWKGLKKAKRNIGELFHKRKYRRLAKLSKDALKWSFKDCLWKFTLKGAGHSWKTNFSNAANATKRKEFAWWLAYPWAVVRSTADNIGRIPAGFAGTAGGTADALALTPAFYIANSPIKAAWNGGIVGLALPTAEVALNTAIAPPLALLGQKPTPERAGGFLVKQLDRSSFSDDEAKLWIRLGRELLKKAEPLEKERENAERRLKERQDSLQKQMQDLYKERSEQSKKFNSQEETIVRDFSLTGSYEPLAKTSRKGKSTDQVARDNMNKIRSALANETDLDQATRTRILYLLSIYFPELSPYGGMLPYRGMPPYGDIPPFR
jgi:hypothetical protein